VLTHTAGPTPLGQTVTQNGNNIRATVNFSFTKDDHGVVDFVAVRASKINSAQHALMASAKSLLFKQIHSTALNKLKQHCLPALGQMEWVA
jgi:hypothetical protein